MEPFACARLWRLRDADADRAHLRGAGADGSAAHVLAVLRAAPLHEGV